MGAVYVVPVATAAHVAAGWLGCLYPELVERAS